MMRILLTNDDGIAAEGIRELAKALALVAEIYVFAPDRERSACGHGISIGRSVQAEEVDFPLAEVAFAMDGLPADCVKMGLDILKKRGISIDKVFSGINLGGNLGTDTVYSGTVSAALEGAICGLPSVAISIDARHPVQFETAKKIALKAATLEALSFDAQLVLNINVPNLSQEEIKGLVVTKLGNREYNEWFKKVEHEDGSNAYIYGGAPIYYENLPPEENDVGASQAGYVSVTPLQYDFTNHALIHKLQKSAWFTE
jgi:5'-nucleotidase